MTSKILKRSAEEWGGSYERKRRPSFVFNGWLFIHSVSDGTSRAGLTS
ncbi:uncharacterized protein An08g03020 [Aspergillus niger]|uniref:Contig An08c0100, genomic contig n=2 Tax=Aspergillus niger TaxID=5061 RepID=A2QQM3_ASPNC|nr:uncharacterized protein An08g03020 [Aspergillus niger]CAK45339.1 unnamed protein product [Aspergillus niger]